MDFECDFETIDGEYTCTLENFENTFERSQKITVTGIHLNGKSNFVVQKLVIENQIMKFIPKDISTHLPNLNMIVIKDSQLSMIQKDDLPPVLNKLYINGNEIVEIEQRSFDGLLNLEIIDLSNNKLTKLPSGAFKDLINLKTLVLNDNLIKKLNLESIILHRNSLEIFSVANNKLTKINGLQRLKKAAVINLSNNTCIDMKYSKTNGSSSQELSDLFTAVIFKCDEDSSEI
jgi:Leucine-rich repeat (LRR) protein